MHYGSAGEENRPLRGGYGDNIDIEAQREELRRTRSMATLIDASTYAVDTYGEAFVKLVALNDKVYKTTYFGLLTVFAILGVFVSFVLGAFAAMAEFFLNFLGRPGTKIFVSTFSVMTDASKAAAKTMQPFLELIFSGSYRFLKLTATSNSVTNVPGGSQQPGATAAGQDIHIA